MAAAAARLAAGAAALPQLPQLLQLLLLRGVAVLPPRRATTYRAAGALQLLREAWQQRAGGLPRQEADAAEAEAAAERGA